MPQNPRQTKITVGASPPGKKNSRSAHAATCRCSPGLTVLELETIKSRFIFKH